MSITLQEIANQVTSLDVLVFKNHRISTGHRSREICDQCPQPITNMIVKFGEDRGIKRRKRQRRGVYDKA